MAKKQSEIVKFAANEPVTVVLDTEPSTAKSTTRDSKWGMKTNYTIFLDGDRVMFASQALFDKLSHFSKGDKVTINLVDGKMWSVTSDRAGAKRNTEVNNIVDSTESTILLRKIALDVDLIKSHLLGTKTYETNAKTAKTAGVQEEDEEDVLDF